MKNDLIVQLSPHELAEVVHAYRIIRNFLEKFISPNDLYNEEFLKGLQESQDEVEAGQFEEVGDFDAFIS